jgi:hypothetical protein
MMHDSTSSSKKDVKALRRKGQVQALASYVKCSKSANWVGPHVRGINKTDVL